jgi:hypothetical protein
MQALTEELLKSSIRDIFSDIDVQNLLGTASDSRRYALVKRALAAGEIVRIRRGLYILAEPFRRGRPDLFSLAARIYGPSYISLESALAARGWIPEQVLSVTSGAFKRSRSFSTPLGRFDFRRSPFSDLAGVMRVDTEDADAYLLATPLRALADLAHDRPGIRMDREFLCQSLRIDPANLESLESGAFDLLLEKPLHSRTKRFLVDLREELKK